MSRWLIVFLSLLAASYFVALSLQWSYIYACRYSDVPPPSVFWILIVPFVGTFFFARSKVWTRSRTKSSLLVFLGMTLYTLALIFSAPMLSPPGRAIFDQMRSQPFGSSVCDFQGFWR